MAEALPFLQMVILFLERDPVGAAHSLETLEESQALEVLTALPAATTAQTVKLLQVGYAATVLKEAAPELFSSIISKLEPSHAASLFVHLPLDVRERFIEHIPEKIRTKIRESLTYPEDSIGRMMSTDFLSFNKEMPVSRAIDRIRTLAKQRFPASYAYVVDDDDHLVGVMNMRDLMLADPDAALREVMRKEVFALNCFTDKEEAADALSKRRYFAAPVVDGQNRIVGIIKAELLLMGIREEASEDLQRIFGAGSDERAFSPILFSLRKRLPWLQVNLATAFLAAGVVALFEGVIARITVLAVFLPVIAGQSGNAGAQSLAVVMRGLVMREIPPSRVKYLILKEGALSVITGLITGVVTGLVAWLWYRNPFLGLVVALGMLANLIVGGFSGASIPIVMKLLGLDPAQCSNIILTTVTDVCGFFAFLGLASLFIDKLL